MNGLENSGQNSLRRGHRNRRLAFAVVFSLAASPVLAAEAVPEAVVAAAKSAVGKLTGAHANLIEVVRLRSVTWPDGALGCPQPDMVYIQAPVPGYQIVLTYQDREFDYRAGRNEYLILCLGQSGEDPPGVAPIK